MNDYDISCFEPSERRNRQVKKIERSKTYTICVAQKVLHPHKAFLYTESLICFPCVYSFNCLPLQTAQQGAKTSLFLAVDPKVEKMTGKYVDGCRPAWTSQKAADLNLAREIFRTSLKLVGLEEREL